MTEKETIKDGLVETFYKNDQLRNRGNYKNGKEHGLWEMFYENGQLMVRTNYKNGKRGLVENFYKNGQLRNRKNYKIGTFKDVFFKIRKWLKTTLPKNIQ